MALNRTGTPFQFDHYERYTITYVAAFNWEVDYVKLTYLIHIPTLAKDPFKGVKKKSKLRLDLPPGTILKIKYKDPFKVVHCRGYGKVDNEGCFRNSATIVLYLDKLIVIKFPPSGKIQIAGCRNEKHAYMAIHALWKHILHIQKTYPDIIRLPEGEHPKVIFTEAMNNISIDVGFNINKKEAHIFLYQATDFMIIPNDTKYAGVTAKLDVGDYSDLPLVQHRYVQGKWYASTVNWIEYLTMLKPKDRIKEESKDKYHSFLIFSSGKVIQTGPRYELMKDAFNYFINAVITNREVIEDKNIQISRPNKIK